jgi:hypothetical protein
MKVSIKEIKPNPNNPRLVKDDKFAKLVQSIKDFPQMLDIRPIVVNKDMIVLGGNMRLKACKEAGLKEIPIIKAEDLTEEQQREFIIKDNLGYGEWDWNVIANEWDAKQLNDWGMDIPNYSFGLDVNNMTDEDVDLLDTFDPIGNSKGLHKIIVIFDNELAAKEWHEKNIPTYEYRKFGGADVSVWHINLSLNYAT